MDTLALNETSIIISSLLCLRDKHCLSQAALDEVLELTTTMHTYLKSKVELSLSSATQFLADAQKLYKIVAYYDELVLTNQLNPQSKEHKIGENPHVI